MSSISITVNDETLQKILYFYKDDAVEHKNPYALLVAKTNDTTITVYKSKKVLFQGKNAETEAQIFSRQTSGQVPKKTPSTHYNSKKATIQTETQDIIPAIGSDEVGTGDYFGPVIVCAAYVDEGILNQLNGLELTDSKQLTDEKIRAVGPSLFKTCPYSLLVVRNEKYNESMNQNMNLNKIKALLHQEAVTQLRTKIKRPSPAIIDQFCSVDNFNKYVQNQAFLNDVIYTTKAESKYISVAIASMMARYKFLEEMDHLSQQYGVTLQKGASAKVDEQGKQLVNKYGEDVLTKIAKLHFKNTQKILNQ